MRQHITLWSHRRKRAMRIPGRRLSRIAVDPTAMTALSALVVAAWTLWLYWSSGRSQQTLTNEQLRLAVRYAAAAGESEVARSKLTAENLGLENQLKRSAVGEASLPRITISHELSVESVAGRQDLYEAYFNVHVTNTTQTSVEVSWAAYEWYLGELPEQLANLTVVEVNAPPKLELEVIERGPVQWTNCGHHGYIYRNSHFMGTMAALRSKSYFQIGGGLTKSLASGAEAEYTMPLLAQADRSRWIGVVAIIGIDGAKPNANAGQNLYFVADWLPLRSVEKPPA